MKKIILLCALTMLFPLSTVKGAEAPDPSQQVASILKKGPSAPKGRIRFRDRQSGDIPYEDHLNREQTTVLQKRTTLFQAETKRESGFRAGSPAITKANEDWQTADRFMAANRRQDLYLDQATFELGERLEKLEALDDVLNIDTDIPALLTYEERLEKQKAHADAKKAGLFMKIATMDISKLEEIMPLLYKNYLQETLLLVDFIVNTLISKKIIEDITLAQKDGITKIQEINALGAFDPQTFQQFVQEYLEAHDYSFEQPAQILAPLAAESATSALP